MQNPIIMHINYCEQGQSLDRVFEVATSIGYDGDEFRRAHKGQDLEEYLNEIYTLKDKYQLEYTLFGGPQLDTSLADPALRQEQIDQYVRFLNIANKLGLLSTVNMMAGPSCDPSVPQDLYHCEAHGSSCIDQKVWDQTVEAVRSIAAQFPQVHFAFETHMFYLHDLVQSAKALADQIGLENVGINLDYGNALFFPHRLPLPETIKTAGERLFYTHFKSYQPIGEKAGQLLPTSLADGCVNHREYVRLLKEAGFTGPIGIEAPRPGDREHFAQEDYDYIAPLIREA